MPRPVSATGRATRASPATAASVTTTRLAGAKAHELALLSRDGYRALFSSVEFTYRSELDAQAWDLRTDAAIGGAAHIAGPRAQAFFPDGEHVFVVKGGGPFGDEGVDVYDVTTWRQVRTMDLPKHQTPSRIAISGDGQRALLAVDDGSIALWNLEVGSIVRRLEGHTGPITSLEFAGGDRYAFSASDDGSLRLFRLDTGASVALVAVGDEWVVYGDDGYFDSSRRGGALVAAVKNLRPFAVDQLAIRNNRADVLLDRMGLGSFAAVPAPTETTW